MSSPFLDKDLRSLSELLNEWRTEVASLNAKRKLATARIRLLTHRIDIIMKVIEEEPPNETPLL